MASSSRRLRMAFMLASGGKAFVFLILQVAYLHLSERREEGSKEMANWLYWLMAWLGNSFRSMGKPALYILTYYIMMPLTFGLINSPLFASWRALKHNNFYLFMVDRKQGKLVMDKETERCVVQVLNSLSNFQYNLKVHGPRATLSRGPPSLGDKLGDLEQADDDGQQRAEARHQQQQEHYGGWRPRCLTQPMPDGQQVQYARPRLKLAHSSTSGLDVKVEEQLEQARRVASRLTAGADLYRCLLPANRNREWREQLLQIGTYLYMLFALISTLAGWLLILATTRAAYYATRRESSQPLDLRQFNHLDRLNCIEHLVYVVLIYDILVHPFVFTFMVVWDQLKYLRLLRLKFRHFFAGIQGCGSSKVDRRRKFAYDQQTVDLYLELLIWTSELQHNMSWVGFVMSQFVCCALSVALFSATFARAVAVSSLELKLASLLGIALVTIIDLFLCLCAAFESACLKLAMRSWSVVAALQPASPELDQPDHYYDYQDQQQHQLNHQQLASGHTLLLWRRLNEDSSRCLDRFSCKLFSLIPANFRTLIRINFSCLSLIVLAYSHTGFQSQAPPQSSLNGAASV